MYIFSPEFIFAKLTINGINQKLNWRRIDKDYTIRKKLPIDFTALYYKHKNWSFLILSNRSRWFNFCKLKKNYISWGFIFVKAFQKFHDNLILRICKPFYLQKLVHFTLKAKLNDTNHTTFDVIVNIFNGHKFTNSGQFPNSFLLIKK